MKQYKRLLAIIPAVFVLLLSCVPMIAAHAELLGQSFVDEIDTDYSEFATEPYDISAFINSISKTAITNDLISHSNSCKGYYQTSDYYFYSVYWLKQETDVFTNSSSSSSYARLDVNFYTIQDLDTVQHDSRFLTYTHACYYRLRCKYYKNGTLEVYDNSYYGTQECFDYCLTTGFCWRGSLSSNQSNLSSYNSNDIAVYSVYEETNIPDFPYAGDYHASSGLNVSVSFNPALSGTVDRKIKADLTNTDLHSWNYDEDAVVSEDIQLSIQNNNRTGIQVMMCIVEPGYRPTFTDGTYYANANAFGCDLSNGNLKFLWVSDEWNYFYDSTTEHGGAGINIVRTHSKSNWHYISPGAFSHKFCWRQINLNFNQSYDVLVYAIPNNWGVSSRNFRFSELTGYLDLSTVQLVYSSNFTCKTPYTFDPNNSSYGNMASTTVNGYNEALWTSDAYVDPNSGETIVGKKSYDDYHDVRYTYLGIEDDDHYTGSLGYNSSGSNFTSLGYSITGFLSFFNRVFSYLPGDFISLIGLSITSLVVVSIFKGVFHG